MPSSDKQNGLATKFIWPVAVVIVGGILLAIILAFLHIGSGPSSSPPSGNVTGGGNSTTTPPVKKSGYALLWHTAAIDLPGSCINGVKFQQNGPTSMLNSSSNVAYCSNNGWVSFEGSLNEWLPAGVPSPGDCVNDSKSASGTLAVVGDQYCFVDNGAPGGQIVVVMKVTGVSQADVTFDASAWT
jgi:hypothetical protein